MSRHIEKTPGDAELLQGTLDMLILKVAALRPIHGYAIVQRIQQISKDALQIRQGSLYPALYRLENRGWLQVRMEDDRGWARGQVLQPDQSRAGSNWSRKQQAGSVFAKPSRWCLKPESEAPEV